MNILLTLSQLEVTGAEVYAVTLADKLVENGHTVYIISDTLTKKTKAIYSPILFNKRNLLNRITQIILLMRFIKRNNIDLIHSNSRASGWVSFFAAKLIRIPKIGTVHGEQAVHASSKRIKVFGDYAIPVCENIQTQLLEIFKFDPSKMEVIRNGICFNDIVKTDVVKDGKKEISLVGRLSGPKGEIAYEILKALDEHFPYCRINVIGGKIIPEYLKGFEKGNINFIGFVDSIAGWIDRSDVVIGSGRVAIESLARGVNTVAVGEACNAGLITLKNLDNALKCNFGDIAPKKKFDPVQFVSDVKAALDGNVVDEKLISEVKVHFNVENFYSKIENRYQSVIVNYHKKEIPVLMYHRLVNDASEAGKHGIYVTAKQFYSHMKYLLIKGFTPITFNDLEKINRFDKQKKYIIITFDDGYEDNYTLLFPILKKFGFKVVIFMVTHSETNVWDTKATNEPVLKLMNKEQITEMAAWGIDFGAHTKTHPDLTAIPLAEAAAEIVDSKNTLEEITGSPVTSFCYPYGRMNDEIKNLVHNCGFKFGIATDSGPLAIHEDFYQIRRIGIFPNTDYLGFIRKVRGHYTFKRVKRENAKKK